jgi:DNA-binding MarR family transcriptional regulator
VRKIKTGDAKVDAFIGLNRVAHIIDGLLERQLAKFSINRSEYTLLDVLKETGSSLRPSDLKIWLHLAKHTITMLINSLEKKGFVQRRIDDSDRRSLQISLTSRGWELIGQIMPVRRQVAHEVMSCLPEEQIERMDAWLETLRTHIDAQGIQNESPETRQMNNSKEFDYEKRDR